MEFISINLFFQCEDIQEIHQIHLSWPGKGSSLLWFIPFSPLSRALVTLVDHAILFYVSGMNTVEKKDRTISHVGVDFVFCVRIKEKKIQRGIFFLKIIFGDLVSDYKEWKSVSLWGLGFLFWFTFFDAVKNVLGNV